MIPFGVSLLFVLLLLVFDASALSDLLEMAADTSSPTATAAHHPPDDAVEHSDDSAVQLRMLSEVARIALSSNGGGGGGARATPKSQSRALALDCLRLGLLYLPDGQYLEDVRASSALDIAAAGAEDERWNVRVAAVGVAREALRKAGVGALLSFLSSKQVIGIFVFRGGVILVV